MCSDVMLLTRVAFGAGCYTFCFIRFIQAPLYNALCLLPDKNWANYMRDGVVAILQNRVGMFN